MAECRYVVWILLQMDKRLIESQIGCCKHLDHALPTQVRVPRHLGNLIRKDTLEPTLTLVTYFAGFCLDVVCKHTDYALPIQVRVPC